MTKKIFLLIIFVVFTFCSACSSNQPIIVDKQSYIRRNETDNTVTAYIVVSNKTKKNVSFEASLILINQNLKNMVGFDTYVFENDDRNGSTPFVLAPSNETVFKKVIKTKGVITKEDLSGAFGIRITALDKIYTIPISYIDIEDSQ